MLQKVGYVPLVFGKFEGQRAAPSHPVLVLVVSNLVSGRRGVTRECMCAQASGVVWSLFEGVLGSHCRCEGRHADDGARGEFAVFVDVHHILRLHISPSQLHFERLRGKRGYGCWKRG